ncbi:MAG: MucB/RseB C-terminal domain-containing protein [Pseudomonadota bacterium]
MPTTPRNRIAATILLIVSGVFVAAYAAQPMTPGEWLMRMTTALETTNYSGTVIRIQNDQAEAMKVVHAVSDGVIHEKLIVQEGNGLEIIRKGNEVYCVLPDKQTVLVEEWDDQSTLFSTLPSNTVRFGSEYDISVSRSDRIAGRKAVVVAIRPHDEFRYAHRLWLDRETGFPLQTLLMDADGSTVEQVKFADIELGQEIHASALKSSYDVNSFRWFAQSQKPAPKAVEAAWQMVDPPTGFRAVSAHEESNPDQDGMLTHLMVSDGLANVSVFIEEADSVTDEKKSRVGASNSFSWVTEGHRITAVGEVPAGAVEAIARSIQAR